MSHESSRLDDQHRECWNALPWLANERLSSEETARIDRHLRQCRECQQELEAQQRLRELVRGDDSLVLAPQAGLQRLMARIEAEENGAVIRPVATDNSAPARTKPSPRRPWLAIAAAVQTIAIGALLGHSWWQTQEARKLPNYIALTRQPPAVAEGPVLRVVFAETVSLKEVNELMLRIGAEVIAGPSEAAVYTLVLRGNGPQRADVDAALATLRADKRVLFSEEAVIAPVK